MCKRWAIAAEHGGKELRGIRDVLEPGPVTGGRQPVGIAVHLSRLRTGGPWSAAMLLLAVLGSGGPARGADLEVGSSDFHSELGISYGKVGNVLRTQGDSVSSGVFGLTPTLGYRGHVGKHDYELDYTGQYARYLEASSEDFADHRIGGRFRLDATPKLDFIFDASSEWAHDSRGGVDTGLDVSPRPDRWRRQGLSVEMVLGRDSSRGQIRLVLGGDALRYTNNGQDDRDRDGSELGGSFYYRYGPKTRFLVELGQSRIDYLRPRSDALDLNSSEYRLMGGVQWQATAKTRGELRAGWLAKDLKDPSLPDFSGVGLQANVSWAPKSYSVVQLQAKRVTGESVQPGASYYVSNRLSLAWNHALTERWLLNVQGSGEGVEFSDGRRDDLLELAVGLDYRLWRWLRLGAEYSHARRGSNLEAARYDSDALTLRLSLSLAVGGGR